MKLELGSFEVTDIVFSDKTSFSNGTLTVDVDKVRDLVLEDANFSGVKLHLARPGESVRLVNVLDVVEPRFKASGQGRVFPGLLGPPSMVGSGRTHRLSGLAVVETSQALPGEPSFWRDSMLDMSGPGAQYNQFADVLNIVLELEPRTEFSAEEREQLELTNLNRGSAWVEQYHRSVRIAGLKVAEHLAECTRGLPPDRFDTHELSPVDETLPRVAYTCQVLFHLYYGEFIGRHPVLVHPNELMDGAVLNTHNTVASTRDATYVLQNHPVVQELYDLHGKELDFAGVFAYRGQINSMDDKERSTDQAVKTLRMMGVDGVVMTWTGAGNPGIDIMLLCQKCEQQGIKTSMINPEMGLIPDDTGFVHEVPEADAIVNAGNYEEMLTLPAVERVIGGPKLVEPNLEAAGELEVPLRYLYGSTNIMGASKLAGIQY
ncbi:MAG: glycine/sarcosine/betaine reductase component B subunit [SAR202 cluster bacterium]|nr:glycine/sarcosine/betaine reductase component B subunit [SAR202 cluster bacterium]